MFSKISPLFRYNQSIFNNQEAIHEIKRTISSKNRVKHEHLKEAARSKNMIETSCRPSLKHLLKSGKSKVSKEEALKLLNSMLLFSMIDSRILLSDNSIKEFQENQSLLELIMTDWVDLLSLRAIVTNVMVLRQSEFGGYYGIYRMTNDMFLNVLRSKLTKKSLKALGLNHQTNQKALNEMRVVAGFFQGN